MRSAAGAHGGDGRPAGERGWLAAELAGGVSTETVVQVASAQAADLRLRAFPLRAGLGLPLAWGGGVILPAVGVNLDLLAFRARGLVDARSGVRVEPAGEVGLGYRAGNRRWFVRGSLWGGLSLAPRDFDAGGEQPVFRTAAGVRAGGGRGGRGPVEELSPGLPPNK